MMNSVSCVNPNTPQCKKVAQPVHTKQSKTAWTTRQFVTGAAVSTAWDGVFNCFNKLSGKPMTGLKQVGVNAAVFGIAWTAASAVIAAVGKAFNKSK